MKIAFMVMRSFQQGLVLLKSRLGGQAPKLFANTFAGCFSAFIKKQLPI
jgi:hypothetical protein